MKGSRYQRISDLLLKGFIVCSVLLPGFYSPYTDVYQSAFYGKLSWAYILLLPYIGIQLWRGIAEKKKISISVMGYLTAIVVYNVLSLYFNYKYLHWYWEQINNTISFVFFAILVVGEISNSECRDSIIRFLIRCIVLSNLASIVFRLLGYTRLLLCNNQVVFFEGNYSEFRHYWIYAHKSEYALMLIAFIALFFVYRDIFKNRVTFVMSLSVLLVCMGMTHSWTAILGCFLIFAGAILDKVNLKKYLKKKSVWIGIGTLVVCGIVLFMWIASERNLTTLNGRTHIWKAALEVIQKYPQGWGMRFGESRFYATETWMVNNAHNLFLNQILRFSIPVGVCFTIMFIMIAVYSLIKAKSFLALGMWAAIFMLVNMDYSLMSNQMAMLFLTIYFVCFNRKTKKDN